MTRLSLEPLNIVLFNNEKNIIRFLIKIYNIIYNHHSKSDLIFHLIVYRSLKVLLNNFKDFIHKYQDKQYNIIFKYYDLEDYKDIVLNIYNYMTINIDICSRWSPIVYISLLYSYILKDIHKVIHITNSCYLYNQDIEDLYNKFNYKELFELMVIETLIKDSISFRTSGSLAVLDLDYVRRNNIFLKLFIVKGFKNSYLPDLLYLEAMNKEHTNIIPGLLLNYDARYDDIKHMLKGCSYIFKLYLNKEEKDKSKFIETTPEYNKVLLFICKEYNNLF